MLFTIVISTLITTVTAQTLCSSPPVCASRYNGNYINCYCVVDPITNLVTQRIVLDKSTDDLNLCENSNQNTFCCPYNLSDRRETFVYNGYVYDKSCNNVGVYTQPPPTLTTANLEGYLTIYITPEASTATPISTVISTQVVPTTVVSVYTQVVPTTVVSVYTQVVPTTVVSVYTQVVPTVTTFTETIYPTPTPNQAAEIGPVPIPVPNPTPTVTKTVVKTVVKTKTVVRTRIYRTTVCPQ